MRKVYIKKDSKTPIINFEFDYNPEIVYRVKEIEGRWWNSKEKLWEIPIDRKSLIKILDICREFDFEKDFKSSEIVDIIRQQDKEDKEYELPKDGDYLILAKRTKSDKLFFVFKPLPILLEEIKEFENIKFITNTRRTGWELNITFDNLKQVIDYLEQPHVYCADREFVKDLKERHKNRNKLKNQSKAIELKNDIEIEGLGLELRPYQKIAVDYILKTKKLFLAEDMGLGKTGESLAAYNETKVQKCLVVCPNSVKYNWLNEANKWLPHKKAVVLEILQEKIDKTRKKRTKEEKKANIRNILNDIGDINIINYNMLVKIWPFIENNKFDMFIFDESHRLKSKNTSWSKFAEKITKKAEYCLLLSGTPIINRPSDLIQQLKILGHLNFFGGTWKFKERYCGLKHTGFGWDDTGASNLDELHERLRSLCYIRRMKSQVLTELPEKQRSYIEIKLNPSQINVYQKAEKDIADWIINNAEEVRKFFASNEFKGRKSLKLFEYQTKAKVKASETLIKISKLRKLAAESKLDDFCDWVDDFMLTNKKLLIFAVHRDLILKLEQRLKKYNPVLIHGGTEPLDRQKNTDLFQTDNRTRILIANIQAGGVGLTLTAASDVAFLEFPWTVGECMQAEDRVYRIGQTNTVNIWYFYIKDTIDIDMISVLQKKEKIINAAVDGLYDEDMYDSIVKESIEGIVKKHTGIIKK